MLPLANTNNRESFTVRYQYKNVRIKKLTTTHMRDTNTDIAY